MDRADFERHVERALASLPPELARGLENVAIVVEDEHPDDPDLFGLYDGVPLPERGDQAGSLPDRITIYQLPLEETFTDPDELEHEIRVTVLHELAHLFGLEEDRIDELGYG
jgi:predicted Zn-dependent protease with MMP-like domain